MGSFFPVAANGIIGTLYRTGRVRAFATSCSHYIPKGASEIVAPQDWVLDYSAFQSLQASPASTSDGDRWRSCYAAHLNFLSCTKKARSMI